MCERKLTIKLAVQEQQKTFRVKRKEVTDFFFPEKGKKKSFNH